MKQSALAFGLSAVLLCALNGCASTTSANRPLTPGAISDDLKGMSNLRKCSFFLSKKITLRYKGNIRDVAVKGFVEAERTLRSRSIRISRSTVGAIQTATNGGEPAEGYTQPQDSGLTKIKLKILFGLDNENVIEFSARRDNPHEKFYLDQTTVKYRYAYRLDGSQQDIIAGFDTEKQDYIIEFEGDERPYLMYKLTERIKEDKKARKEPGRVPDTVP
jgi:hypothetical protein